MLHNVKIQKCSLCHILEGDKTFVLLKNCCDFQVGDMISFLPLADDDEDGYDPYLIKSPIPKFKITYALSDNYPGLGNGWIILAIQDNSVESRLNRIGKESS